MDYFSIQPVGFHYYASNSWINRQLGNSVQFLKEICFHHILDPDHVFFSWCVKSLDFDHTDILQKVWNHPHSVMSIYIKNNSLCSVVIALSLKCLKYQ